MDRTHVNDRGRHTSVADTAVPVIEHLIATKSLKVTISPGRIEGGIGAKSKSIKLKHINNEVYEMVVTHNSSRQEFKIFTLATPNELIESFKTNKKTRDWNVNYTDMRGTGTSLKSERASNV